MSHRLGVSTLCYSPLSLWKRGGRCGLFGKKGWPARETCNGKRPNSFATRADRLHRADGKETPWSYVSAVAMKKAFDLGFYMCRHTSSYVRERIFEKSGIRRKGHKKWLYSNLWTNFHFVPVCVETLGTFGEDGLLVACSD